MSSLTILAYAHAVHVWERETPNPDLSVCVSLHKQSCAQIYNTFGTCAKNLLNSLTHILVLIVQVFCTGKEDRLTECNISLDPGTSTQLGSDYAEQPRASCSAGDRRFAVVCRRFEITGVSHAVAHQWHDAGMTLWPPTVYMLAEAELFVGLRPRGAPAPSS